MAAWLGALAAGPAHLAAAELRKGPRSPIMRDVTADWLTVQVANLAGEDRGNTLSSMRQRLTQAVADRLRPAG